MRRALRFLAVVAPLLSCGALAACTADDDDERVVSDPDAGIDDTTPNDATVAPPVGDATVQMDTDATGDDDDASTSRDASRDAGKDASDASLHEAEGGLKDGGHDAADAADASDASDAADAGHDSGVDAGPPMFTIGGTIIGIGVGDALTLDNGTDTFTLAAEAIPAASTSFTFAKMALTGAAYSVTVAADPATPLAQHCTVANGKGTVAAADVTTIVVTCVDAFWINPATGLDTNAGTNAAPWKTLTHAIATAPTAGATFYVEPGVYNVASGETFPILPKSNQTFIGDVANAGAAAAPTQIIGYGTSGAFSADVVLSGVVNVSMSGLLVGAVATNAGAGGTYGMIVDDSSATLVSNSLGSDGAVDLAIEDGSIVTLTSNSLTGNATTTLSLADPTTTVTARSNTFAGSEDIVVALGATLAKLDFGTAASLGNNSISQGGSGVTFVGLTVDATGGTMDVVGNIWTPIIQNAEITGRYPAMTVAGPVAAGIFDNYAIAAGATLQF